MKLGIDKQEITFFDNNIILFGNGSMNQYTNSIYLPLYVRTFYISNKSKCIYYIILDLSFITNTFRSALLLELVKLKDCNCSTNNIILTCIHTHTSPGGYFDNIIYDISSGGFRQDYQLFLINKIKESCQNSYKNSFEGNLYFVKSKLQNLIGISAIKNIIFNRSLIAFNNNPDELKNCFPLAVNDDINLLIFKDSNNKFVGLIQFMSLHGTCLGTNNFISGDIRGLLSNMFEKEYSIICGQPQETHGDCSPNVNRYPDSEISDIPIMINKAKTIFNGIKSLLDNNNDHEECKLNDVIYNNFIYNTNASIGISVLAGSNADHTFIEPFKENINMNTLKMLNYCGLCKYKKDEKISIFSSNKNFVDELVNIHHIEFDKVTIICVPFEVTTCAGQYLKNNYTKTKNKNIILNSLSNGYLHYVTTEHEYITQQYEGSVTLYGQNQLEILSNEINNTNIIKDYTYNDIKYRGYKYIIVHIILKFINFINSIIRYFEILFMKFKYYLVQTKKVEYIKNIKTINIKKIITHNNYHYKIYNNKNNEIISSYYDDNSLIKIIKNKNYNLVIIQLFDFNDIYNIENIDVKFDDI